MDEENLGPEVREILPKAVNEVVGLYLGDQMSNLLHTQSPDQRDQMWKEQAQQFPPLTENILALRAGLKNADITKKSYDPNLAIVIQAHFASVQDVSARELLSDVLIARTIKEPGYFDYGMSFVKEAIKMTEEMGIKDGLRSPEMKDVSLDKVVGSLLVSQLKVTRQE